MLKASLRLLGSLVLLGSFCLPPLPASEARPAALAIGADPPNAGQIPLDLKELADYANVVYIDPMVSVSGNGTLTSPLKSWINVTFAADTAYVQKRGTTDTVTVPIRVSSRNVLVGAYGPDSDPRPIIYSDVDTSTGNKYSLAVITDSVTVRDLEIVSPRATSAIYFAAGYAPQDGVAWNNYVHGVDQSHYLGWGIRVFGPRTKVLSNTIAYTGDDGLFIQDAPMVEIGYNHITRVNQKWFATPAEANSPGDGIQLDSDINGFYIHHNDVDRSDTGNKFCIIANTDLPNVAGLIENNTCLIAKDRVPLYLTQYSGSPVNYRVVVRNNFFQYTDTASGGVGIWNHAPYVEIYNNVIVGFARGLVLTSGTVNAQVYHNTFSNISGYAVDSSLTRVVNNNIFDLGATGTAFSSSSNLSATHNLFTRSAQAAGSNPVVGDPRFTNAANSNFHLRAGSAAQDAGQAGSGVLADADGNPRDTAPDIGAYEFQPLLNLYGTPANRTIYLNWKINFTLPVTTTWTISYTGPDGTPPSPVTGLASATRAYTLSGLTNYAWYTVTLSSVGFDPVLSDTVRLMPTNRFIYLPAVLK